jgi:hypothetical protein
LCAHSERKPFVTLRTITLGRNARSQALLVAETARSVTNRNRWARSRAMRRRNASAASLRRGNASTQPSFQIGLVLRQRASAQRVSSSADGNRAQQQALERRREPVVAAIDGVLRVAQHISEAEMVCLSKPLPVAKLLRVLPSIWR